MRLTRAIATLSLISTTLLVQGCADPPSSQDQALTEGADACQGNDEFLVGAGSYDITGPAAGVGMMGYGSVEQTTAGIHMRLRSRAFVIASPCNGERIAFVSGDTSHIFQAVKLEVVRRLRETFGDLYDEGNVILSATHTHSVPGGFSHYKFYNLTSLGYDRENFETIVDGIYRSIARAHHSARPGRILVNDGDLTDASFQRSPLAYERNPQSERQQHDGGADCGVDYPGACVDTGMTMLRLEQDGGEEIGMINWFAVHATSIGNENRLISGDNKGYASYLFEKEQGREGFVAAFANSNEGDVSPNLWGAPDHVHDLERNATIGARHDETARELYDMAEKVVVGGVRSSHDHVDFSRVQIDGAWTADGGAAQTCPATIGVSMIAGSIEDGGGASFIPEGFAYGSVDWFVEHLPRPKWAKELQACHGEKPILFPMGRFDPPWTPEVLPVQVATVGNLAIVALPFEMTTMAGRRVRDVARARLAPLGIDSVVIAGLANAYAGYVATAEEYDAQHYEGASTHFGPHTLDAVEQEVDRVGQALLTGTTLDGPRPRDTRDVKKFPFGDLQKPFKVLYDTAGLFRHFGDVRDDVEPSYRLTDSAEDRVARLVVRGAHPRNAVSVRLRGPWQDRDERLSEHSFVDVQRNEGGVWKTVADDSDPTTRFLWKRSGVSRSVITVEWHIPVDALPGTYRLVHRGYYKKLNGGIKAYDGTSRDFVVE